MSARGGVRKLCQLEYRLSARKKPFPQKNTKLLISQKLMHLDDVIFKVLAFGVRVVLHKICFFVTKFI